MWSAARRSRLSKRQERTLIVSGLRHAFASRMIARGIELVTLAKLMGHEDIRETLNTYAGLWDRARTDDVVRDAMSL